MYPTESKKFYTVEIQQLKNYLNQEFVPDAPNRVLVNDVPFLIQREIV